VAVLITLVTAVASNMTWQGPGLDLIWSASDTMGNRSGKFSDVSFRILTANHMLAPVGSHQWAHTL